MLERVCSSESLEAIRDSDFFTVDLSEQIEVWSSLIENFETLVVQCSKYLPSTNVGQLGEHRRPTGAVLWFTQCCKKKICV